METAGNGPGAQKGVEYFLDEVNLVEEAKEVAKVALTMLDAKECPSGKMPVIIGNGFGGVIFHEACGHSLEASSVAKGVSVFSGKKGTKIAVVGRIQTGSYTNKDGQKVYTVDVIAEETYDKNGMNRTFEFFSNTTKRLLDQFDRHQLNDIHQIIHFCAENPLNLETDEIVDKD